MHAEHFYQLFYFLVFFKYTIGIGCLREDPEDKGLIVSIVSLILQIVHTCYHLHLYQTLKVG